MPHGFVKFVTILIIATSIQGCDIFSKEHIYRYRLNVEIETPAGLRSGSSVIEARAYEGGALEGHIVHSELRGEAVAIDIAGGQTLFGLLQSVDGLTGAYASAAYSQMLPESINKNADWRVSFDAIGVQTAVAEVPPSDYPIFVMFSDINDPASAKLVGVYPLYIR
jgi:hypothetical protein